MTNANYSPLLDENGLLYYHQKLKTALNDKVDKRTGYSLLSDDEITRLATLTNYNDSDVQKTLSSLSAKIEELGNPIYDDTEIRNLLNTISTDLETLKNIAITGIKVNGVAITPNSEKSISISVPKTVAELTDANDYITATKLTEKGYITNTELNNKGYAIASDVYSKEQVDAKMSKAMHYKGGVDTYNDLPSSSEIGDMYNVKTANPASNINAGDNVVWDGEKWDNQGGTIDLSHLVSKDDIITNADIDAMWSS